LRESLILVPERLLKSKKFTKTTSIIITMKEASAIMIMLGTATLTLKKKIIILMITRDTIINNMTIRDTITRDTVMEDAIMVSVEDMLDTIMKT